MKMLLLIIVVALSGTFSMDLHAEQAQVGPDHAEEINFLQPQESIRQQSDADQLRKELQKMINNCGPRPNFQCAGGSCSGNY